MDDWNYGTYFSCLQEYPAHHVLFSISAHGMNDLVK